MQEQDITDRVYYLYLILLKYWWFECFCLYVLSTKNHCIPIHGTTSENRIVEAVVYFKIHMYTVRTTNVMGRVELLCFSSYNNNNNNMIPAYIMWEWSYRWFITCKTWIRIVRPSRSCTRDNPNWYIVAGPVSVSTTHWDNYAVVCIIIITIYLRMSVHRTTLKNRRIEAIYIWLLIYLYHLRSKRRTHSTLKSPARFI